MHRTAVLAGERLFRRLKTPRKVKMRRCFCFIILIACLAVFAERPGGRFISLSPSITEIMFAIGAGDSLAGVTAPADHPPEASTKEIVASYDGILFEKIAAMRPRECLTVSGMQSGESLGVIRRLGISVTEYPVSTLDELIACIVDVGKKCGREAEAGKLAERIRKSVEKISKEIPFKKERAIFLVGLDPAVAAGKGSYLNDLCRAAGFVNVLEQVPPSYSVISFDTIAGLDPDWIILPEGEIGKESREEFVGKIRAVNKKIMIGEISADLIMRPGPRVVEGVEKLAELRKGKKK